MKAIQIKRFWPTADKLKILYLKERDGRRKERLLAVILMLEIKSIPKVASIIKRRRDTVWKWIKRFNQRGLAGLWPKKKPGKKRILTDEETAELDKDLQKEPAELGYEFPTWTSKTVAYHIEQRFGKKMCDRTALEYMHELDYTQQVPEVVAADADPEAQAKFEEDIKK